MWEDNLWNEMKRMRRKMNRMFRFSDFPEEPIEEPSDYRHAWTDFKETEDSFKIKIEVPGVEKENISIEIRGNELVVKAEKKQEAKKEDDSGYHYAKAYAGFFRSVRLPEPVDEEDINAEYTNGVLIISIPKKKIKDKKVVRIK